jgi:predicted Zn-dependent protease with MMP-like domain
MNPEAFENEVDRVLAGLPPWVKAEIDNLIVVVERRPTYDQDPTGTGLLGLYEGVSLADRGVDYFAVAPDQITIFYQPHVALGLDDDDLRGEIRTTVLHELAHHLGIDDQRLHELGWD